MAALSHPALWAPGCGTLQAGVPGAGTTLGPSLCLVKAWQTLKSCVNINPLAALPGKMGTRLLVSSSIADGKPFFMQEKLPEQLPL